MTEKRNGSVNYRALRPGHLLKGADGPHQRNGNGKTPDTGIVLPGVVGDLNNIVHNPAQRIKALSAALEVFVAGYEMARFKEDEITQKRAELESRYAELDRNLSDPNSLEETTMSDRPGRTLGDVTLEVCKIIQAASSIHQARHQFVKSTN